MSRTKEIIVLFSIFLLIIPSFSFGKDKLGVVASFYPIYDFTRNIGGEKVEVSVLIPFNVEPHDWEPSPGDVIKLHKADLFIYNGKSLESWAENFIRSSNNKNLRVLDLSKAINMELQDPHIWLDPILVKLQAKAIKDELIALDPKNKAYYEKNYIEYSKKLDALDKEIRKVVSRCKKREFVVLHAAFSYFAKRYGLTQISITGISPEAEPSAKDVAEITKFVKDHKIKYIFAEPLVSPALVNSIAQETGAKILILDPIEGLSKKDLDMEKDYISKMKENLENLKLALEFNG
ncbi:MAG: metal ABC transporter substrate-binding protein [bacterium]